MSQKREPLLKQCKAIRQNSMYTAETHHIISGSKGREAMMWQSVPAIITAVLVSVIGFGIDVVPEWMKDLVTPLALISAIVSAVGNVVDPKSSYYAHLNAAKLFTQVKNEAQALCDGFSPSLSDSELLLSVEKLQAKYDTIVIATPATDDKAFEKARAKVKQGRHELD